MTLEIKVDESNISDEEIQEFQKNLTEHIQSIMAANNEEIEDNVHDYHFKPLSTQTYYISYRLSAF